MTYPICWTAADVFINNSVYPKYLGMVNGISMAVSFLFRSASPLGAGALFSWSITTGFCTMGFPFGHHFVFAMIGVAILTCLFIGLFAPKKLDKQPETWDLMEQIPEMKPEDLLERLKTYVGGDLRNDSGSSHAERLLHAHEEEARRVRLFNASFSSSLSYQISHRRQIRRASCSAMEDSSPNTSRFHSARENISDAGKSPGQMYPVAL